MEMSLGYRFVAGFIHLLARVILHPMRYIRDLSQAERVGIDKPALFERILMKVFPYREITKPSGPQRWIYEDNGLGRRVREHNVLYLRRFFLTPRKWPVRIFLHHICRSDDDRAPHTHPWDFTTCPVRGSYSESIDLRPDKSGRPADVRFVQAGDRHDNPAEHVHRVDLVAPMWTLVVSTRGRRMWGFVLPDGTEVPWRKYLNLSDEPESLEDV